MKTIPDNFINKKLTELPFVILDLETTGFKPQDSAITEVAVISIVNGIEEQYQTLINPEISIPYEITKLTGITNRMVEDKPVIADVLPHLKEMFRDCIFVSHNVPFDWAFLDYAFKKHFNENLLMPSLCTLRTARKFLNLSSNKLAAVAQHFDIKLVDAHRAMNDTLAVRDILFKLLKILEREGIKTAADLYRQGIIFPQSPPPRDTTRRRY